MTTTTALPHQYLLLTGDIGGTNSRMALYAATSANGAAIDSMATTKTKTTTTTTTAIPKPLVEKYYRNSEHITNPKDPNIFATAIIIPFLQYCFEQSSSSLTVPIPWNEDIKIIATLAVAGMVLDNSVQLTNLDNMIINGTAIVNSAVATNTQSNKYLQQIVICRIINDFVAQGYGCLTLQQHEVRPLYGTIAKLSDLPNDGPKVCIGAGTGLGECYLTPNTGATDVSYTCYASEGGHIEYAPRNDVEIEMFQYLSKKFESKNRISVERVVSGKGLANVYEFLSVTYPSRIIQSIHDKFLIAGDEQGRIVAENVNNCSLCEQAMSIMMSAYGCETGSVAIKFIPRGGLFVTGGLTPKNIQYIDGLHTDFMISYLNKGRVSPLLQHVPLFAVMVEDLGVRGAYKSAQTEYHLYLEQLKHTSSTSANTTNPTQQPTRWLQYGTIAAMAAIGGYFLVRKQR